MERYSPDSQTHRDLDRETECGIARNYHIPQMWRLALHCDAECCIIYLTRESVFRLTSDELFCQRTSRCALTWLNIIYKPSPGS